MIKLIENFLNKYSKEERSLLITIYYYVMKQLYKIVQSILHLFKSQYRPQNILRSCFEAE